MQIQVVYIFTELIKYIMKFISWEFLLAFKQWFLPALLLTSKF